MIILPYKELCSSSVVLFYYFYPCISLISVFPNLRSGVILFIYFLFFASLLLWLERGKNNALLPNTDYRDKGRGHDRRLGFSLPCACLTSLKRINYEIHQSFESSFAVLNLNIWQVNHSFCLAVHVRNLSASDLLNKFWCTKKSSTQISTIAKTIYVFVRLLILSPNLNFRRVSINEETIFLLAFCAGETFVFPWKEIHWQ